jgi:hypothetical protein
MIHLTWACEIMVEENRTNHSKHARMLLYSVGPEKVARLPFARVLVIFSLALVYCVE